MFLFWPLGGSSSLIQRIKTTEKTPTKKKGCKQEVRHLHPSVDRIIFFLYISVKITSLVAVIVCRGGFKFLLWSKQSAVLCFYRYFVSFSCFHHVGFSKLRRRNDQRAVISAGEKENIHIRVQLRLYHLCASVMFIKWAQVLVHRWIKQTKNILYISKTKTSFIYFNFLYVLNDSGESSSVKMSF